VFVVEASIASRRRTREEFWRGHGQFLDGFEVEEWRQWVSMCPPVAGEGVGDELKQKSPAGGGWRIGLYLGIDGGCG